MIWSQDDFRYAIENTEVIFAPERKIATFGQTSFRFYLISELMDKEDELRHRPTESRVNFLIGKALGKKMIDR